MSFFSVNLLPPSLLPSLPSFVFTTLLSASLLFPFFFLLSLLKIFLPSSSDGAPCPDRHWGEWEEHWREAEVWLWASGGLQGLCWELLATHGGGGGSVSGKNTQLFHHQGPLLFNMLGFVDYPLPGWRCQIMLSPKHLVCNLYTSGQTISSHCLIVSVTFFFFLNQASLVTQISLAKLKAWNWWHISGKRSSKQVIHLWAKCMGQERNIKISDWTLRDECISNL